jgi:HSP20 family protein
MANTIVRWNPLREIAAMQNAMDRMFDDAWQATGNGLTTLELDVHEDANAYTVIADVPGVNPEHIDVNFHDGALTIAVEIEKTETSEDSRVLLQERFTGKMSRRINLPQLVDVDDVEANYNAGVLTLMLPKAEEAKPRQIPVRNGKDVLQSSN